MCSDLYIPDRCYQSNLSVDYSPVDEIKLTITAVAGPYLCCFIDDFRWTTIDR